MRYLIAIVIFALLIHGFFHPLQHWAAVHTGVTNEQSVWYAFWSGFGSDLSEATIVTGMIAAYRHHNCHSVWCPRLGNPVAGTPYLACPKHHPHHLSHKGSRRGVHPEVIVAAAKVIPRLDSIQES